MNHTLSSRGFTFIELLVTIAIVGLVFGGMVEFVQFSLKLISETKVSTSALALANERIEYIRSLPYDQIGTQSGIPSGSIPQNATSTLNGVLFHERVLVQYVDSPDDGVGGSDTNGIVADYKEVKVEFSWADVNGTSTLFLVTNVVPVGVETTAGGGTLTVNVFDGAVTPVSGAEVRLRNNTTTTTIDTVRYTNASGIAQFAGAPAAADYEISVTKTDYSTDGTYLASSTNPNPVTPPVAVVEGVVSTMNFQIDEESTLTVRTVGEATIDSFEDSFDDMSLVESLVDTVVSGGAVSLSGSAGSYSALGTVHATTASPASFDSWDTLIWDGTVPVGTNIIVRLYSESGTLIPDSDLPGNAAGFTSSPINISNLSAVTYPELVLGAELTSSDPNVTPELTSWSLAYILSEPPISGVPFTLTGVKIMGTTASGSPIYKYERSHTTDSGGEREIAELEWDLYNLELTTGAYDIKEACAALPYVLNPGVSETLKLSLMPSTAYSLRVTVQEGDGDPILGADVELSRSGFTETETTSSCGQVFFNSGVVSAADYSIAVTAPGYTSTSMTDYTIDGDESLTITLVP